MKNKYAWLLVAGFSGVGPVARAQQVLLHSEVARDTLTPRTGPNRRYFGHFYLGYGLVAGGSSAGLPLRYGVGSTEVQLGGRLKRRFTNDLRLRPTCATPTCAMPWRRTQAPRLHLSPPCTTPKP